MKVVKNHAWASRSRSVATPTIAMLVLMVIGFALAFAGSARSATAINLGAAESFGALSFTAMTNADAAGPTVVSGDVGSPTSVGAGVTNPGFARFDGPTQASGMASAQAAVTAAWISAGSQPTTGDVTGNLGGTKVVGTRATPTPPGKFFIEEIIRLRSGDAGGPFTFALSARSNVLQEFAGGPGQIALHGLMNVGGTLGTAVSHGCVRLDNSAIRWLNVRIGPGVPGHDPEVSL